MGPKLLIKWNLLYGLHVVKIEDRHTRGRVNLNDVAIGYGPEASIFWDCVRELDQKGVIIIEIGTTAMITEKGDSLVRQALSRAGLSAAVGDKAAILNILLEDVA